MSIQDVFAGMDMALESLRARAMFPHAVDVEDAKTVKVGETYFVTVVMTREDCPARGAYFPVLGDEHSDADFISIFPDNVPHWHIDWRFIPQNLYPSVVELFLTVFGQNAESFDRSHGVQNAGYAPGTRNLQLACVLPASIIVGVQRWPLPCWRQQLRWEAVPDWLVNLERAYRDKKVCDNVCPHRGISLTGTPEDKNGVRVCPGHGLAWDKDGCLVPRSKVAGK